MKFHILVDQSFDIDFNFVYFLSASTDLHGKSKFRTSRNTPMKTYENNKSVQLSVRTASYFEQQVKQHLHGKLSLCCTFHYPLIHPSFFLSRTAHQSIWRIIFLPLILPLPSFNCLVSSFCADYLTSSLSVHRPNELLLACMQVNVFRPVHKQVIFDGYV